MSYWDDKELNAGSEGGYYIKLKDGESKVLVFHGHEKRPQKEGTEEKFKSADGLEFMWKFSETVDGKDVERAYTNHKAGNAFVIGMKQAGIEPGDTFRITRKGAGASDTRYECAKIVDGVETVKEDAPF